MGRFAGQHGPANNNRYFIIKANSTRAVDASVSKCVWAFTPNTERKLLHNFKVSRGTDAEEARADAVFFCLVSFLFGVQVSVFIACFCIHVSCLLVKLQF